jgi:hypothetical protein
MLQIADPGVIPDSAIIHSDETFRVQWKAVNLGPDDAPAFTDRLVVSAIPEGCPGSDDQDHPVVYDSTTDGLADDFAEPALPAGTAGPLMAPMVGPFGTGSYRLTVTLDADGPNPVSTFNCIEIVDPI